MLVSEILEWQYAITWDNATPHRNSTNLRAALALLGNVTDAVTVTTVILSPKADVTYLQVRAAITDNLDPNNGGAAMYVNMRRGKAYHWGPDTGHKWQKAN